MSLFSIVIVWMQANRKKLCCGQTQLAIICGLNLSKTPQSLLVNKPNASASFPSNQSFTTAAPSGRLWFPRSAMAALPNQTQSKPTHIFIYCVNSGCIGQMCNLHSAQTFAVYAVAAESRVKKSAGSQPCRGFIQRKLHTNATNCPFDGKWHQRSRKQRITQPKDTAEYELSSIRRHCKNHCFPKLTGMQPQSKLHQPILLNFIDSKNYDQLSHTRRVTCAKHFSHFRCTTFW